MNPIRIFIVEDELLISASLKSQLQSFGYEVLGSSTRGLQCIEEVERFSAMGKEPEIILMDIHIRGDMDGIETARRLVEKFNCAIIFLTGQSSKEIYDRSFKIKPFGYLLKPIDMEQTKMTIEIAAYQRNLEMENVIYQQKLENLLEERKKENTEIRTLYDALTDDPLVGMLIVQDEKIVFSNQQIAKLLGYTKLELNSLGTEALMKRIQTEDKLPIAPVNPLAPVAEQFKTGRCRITSQDGKPVSVKFSARPLTYHGNRALHLIFVEIPAF